MFDFFLLIGLFMILFVLLVCVVFDFFKFGIVFCDIILLLVDVGGFVCCIDVLVELWFG